MCEHEGKPCPGRFCKCVCDNCVLGPGDEDEFECDLCPVTYPHNHSSVQWDDVWGLVPSQDDRIA